jgi:hypothetical protein
MSGPEATVLGLNPVSRVKHRSNEIEFKFNTRSNFLWHKQDIPEVEKIEIKYGREGFKEGNNFLHRNMFIFEMDIRLEFRESEVWFRLYQIK